jgi:uncharacterized protein YutD
MSERTLKERPVRQPIVPMAQISQVAPDLITIDGRRYQLVKDHKAGFDKAKFAERYMDVLEKYDYIVGDWGYEQLRLRGFYRDDNRRASKDQLIGTLEDYLYEYCNFGCAFFVLQRLDAPAVKPKRRRGGKSHHRKAVPYEEKTVKSQALADRAETVAKAKPRKRHFTIKTRESD